MNNVVIIKLNCVALMCMCIYIYMHVCIYIYTHQIMLWLMLWWLYIASCQIIRQESILIACGVKIGLGGTLGASIIYIVFLGSHTAPKKLFWTSKKEELILYEQL